MRWSKLTLALGILCLAAPAFAGPKLVFAQPGGPGSTEQAQKVMAEFAKAVGGSSAIYFNELTGLRKYLDEHEPEFGMLSLDAFLKLRKGDKLVPIARAVPAGRDRLRYMIVVRKDGPADLEALTGKRLTRSGLDDARFISAVVLDGKLDASKQLKLVRSKRPLRAIRDVIRKKVDAALVDEATMDALRDPPEEMPQLKKYASQIKVIFTSADLPTAPVVRIAGRGDPAPLVAALTGLSAKSGAKGLLETFALKGFSKAGDDYYRKVVRAYEQWGKKKE